MRILVVDDHELIRKGICSLFAAEPSITICGEAVDGQEAIEKAQGLRPDVVVMDLSMPHSNGLEATREIKRLLPETEIVIVSQHETPEMFREASNAGALGYVVKSSISRDLLAAVAKAAQHQPFVNRTTVSSKSADAGEIIEGSDAFEHAFRHSEERFRSAMNSMAEGLYTIDREGLVTSVNPSAEAMFGWSSAELLGKKMHDVTHYKYPDGRPFPATDCPGLRVLREGIELREHQDTFIRKDGTLFPVVFSASPLRTENEINGVVVCFRDDSKRREAELALQRVARQFQLVTDTVAVAVVRCSRDLRFLWVNSPYAKWIGRPSEEFAGRPIAEMVGGEAFQKLRPYFARVLEGETVLLEEELDFKGLGRRWISATYVPTLDPAGIADGWVASIVDITDRKRRDAELARQARLLDFSFNAVIVLGKEGRITYWNKGAEELYGWTQEEARGQVIHALLRTEFPEPLESITSRLRREERWQGELLHSAKNGRRLTVLSRWALTRDEGTNAESIMEVNTDVTQAKEAERQMQLLVHTLETRISERTRELERATEKLRELSGKLLQTQDEERRRIARELHDGVGQILAAINMNLSMLAGEKEKLGDQSRHFVSESAELVEQASQEIRTMSHLLHPPLLDEVGLESALRWYVDGFAERSKISVSMRLTPGFSNELPRDLSLSLFRIVQESLTNIHRHSGSLTASVEIKRTADTITVRIKDVGRGIPAELQSKITSGESSGVGLRGMRERIRQFAGRLDVQSDRGGTLIVAFLPILDSASSSPARAGAPENPPDGNPEIEASAQAAKLAAPEPVHDGATILCIDDEATGLLTRKMLLESAGHRVIEARSGAEGIELFRSQKVDVVILDYWMAGMKGTAVASELKRLKPDVPIVVLSGMSDLPGEAAGIVDQWLVKGTLRAEQLLGSINALLERRPV